MAKRTVTSCDMVIERLSAFLDRDLSATECARISRHVARCARCTTLTTELRETMGMCQRASKAPLPPALRQRARHSIQRLLKERAEPR